MTYGSDMSFPYYPALDGSALEGVAYFGVAGQNPVTNPVTVFWDSAGTQPASQPVTISKGRTVRSDGTPARVWVASDYSVLVQDTLGRQVVFEPNQPVTIAAVNAINQATTQAGVATTQAGIATTQAGLAAVAKTAAETARDVAQAAQRIYANTAAGIAATTSGQYFYVPSAVSTQSLLLYLNSAGSAALQKNLLSYEGAVATAASVAASEFGIFNIFDKSARTDGAVLADGSSSTSALAGYFVTAYMPVVAGDYITSNQSGVGGYGLHFFDANRTLLSSPGPIAANTPYVVPTNAAYVRATFQKSATSGGRSINTEHDLVIVQGQVLPAYYMPFSRPSAYAWWRQMQIESYEFPLRNIHNAATAAIDFALNISTGAVTAAAGNFVTDYIPVVPGDTYTVYNSSGNNVLNGGAAFYDFDKGFMYGQDGAFTTGLTQITVPAACFWMRLTRFTASSTVSLLQVYRGTSTPGSVAQIRPAMYSDLAGQWAGKSWFVQGDSITDGTGWFEAVAAFHGATVAQNAALGGRSMVNALKKHDGTSLASGDFTGVGMAVLFLGANDYRTGTPIGTISDSTATASFYGYAKNFVETVLGWKPLIRLVIATPMRMTIDSPNNDPINYVTALRAIAARYALPVLDFYALSGFNDITMATLTTDGLHPNAAGLLAGVTNPAIGFFKTCQPVT